MPLIYFFFSIYIFMSYSITILIVDTKFRYIIPVFLVFPIHERQFLTKKCLTNLCFLLLQKNTILNSIISNLDLSALNFIITFQRRPFLQKENCLLVLNLFMLFLVLQTAIVFRMFRFIIR